MSRRRLMHPRDTAAMLAAVDEQMRRQAQAWLESRLAALPYHWSRYVLDDFGRRGGVESPQACRWLIDATDIDRSLVRISASDHDIRVAADVAAREAIDMVVVSSMRGVHVMVSLERTCARWGISPAVVSKRCNGDIWPAVRRMMCRRWWLRRLRSDVVVRCESAAIRAGLVHRRRWAYASEDTVERRCGQRRRQRESIARAVIEDVESGETISMADVVAGSVASPEIRRGELMTRVRGCDEYAELKGWVCEFWTLTTPSRYHARRVVGQAVEANPSWEGATPRDAHRWLMAVWARARSAWARRDLRIMGMRTAEPHHDATPHWHVIVYGSARDVRYARRLLRVYALRDCADEPGARKHRYRYLRATGVAGAAYAAKYVAKNIDGRGVVGDSDSDESGSPVNKLLARVDAWAAAWRIRQFGFFGAATVTAWRTLRRVSEQCAVSDKVPLERARMAADDGDWCGYQLATDESVAGRWGLVREPDRLSQYGDAIKGRVCGVADAGRRAMVRLKQWVIHWGGVSGRDEAAVGETIGLPRSRVNNCTGDRLPDEFAAA